MSEQRVFFFDKMNPAIRDLPDNSGQVVGRWIIERDKPMTENSRFSGVGVNQLMPNSVIPWHPHPTDEEVYFFVSGNGFYVDNGKVKHPVKCGDAAVCLKGEGHGLENPGPEPLLFVAVIAK